MTKPPQKALYVRMRELADTGHPRAQELRAAADGFLATAKSYWGPEMPGRADVKLFLKHWATARRIWSECSGEPLLPGL